MSEQITETHLNDLRRRILDHEKAVAAGTADASEPPYTIDELKKALAAISLNREAIATSETRAPRRAAAKTIDLGDLL